MYVVFDLNSSRAVCVILGPVLGGVNVLNLNSEEGYCLWSCSCSPYQPRFVQGISSKENLTSISPMFPLPAPQRHISSISLLAHTLIFPLCMYPPASAILCPQFSSATSASSSSLSFMSERATRPSVDADNSKVLGVLISGL